ncbi:MAG: hypothetical protein HPY52_13105 [Firmicutes bacterium]|nr:hypothetical protein [Bacillota bacterium]
MYQLLNTEGIRDILTPERLRKVIVLAPGEIRDDLPREEILERCREIVSSPIPETPYTFFAEFYKTGNRSHYEVPARTRRQNMLTLALGSFLTGDASFLARLQDYIWAICEEATWCWPAHLPEELDFSKAYIDLGASMTAELLGEILDILGDRFDLNLKKRVIFELNRRIFAPFLECPDDYWWSEGYWSNWCAVCCAAIGTAAITSRLPEPQLSKMISDITIRLNHYLEFFDEEGGWVEGVGYWNYGLTHLARFADSLFRVSEGRLNMFEHPKLNLTGSFPLHCFLPPDGFVSFGDCHPGVKLGEDLVYSLMEHTLLGPELAWLLEILPKHRVNRFESIRGLRNRVLPAPLLPSETYRHFKGIDWLVTRRSWKDKLGPVLAVKAGNNGEPHNHVDVGQFIFHTMGQDFLTDLGAGLYTRAYFSQERYKNPFCNAEGHSLVFIDGKSQGIGKEFQGKIEEFRPGADKDTVMLDLTGAYPGGLVTSLNRRLELGKKPAYGELLLTDEVCVPEKAEIELRLQLGTKPRRAGEREFLLTGYLGDMVLRVLEPERVSLECRSFDRLETSGGAKDSYFMRIIAKESQNVRFCVQVLEA